MSTRVRLSLETTADVKAEFLRHGADLGQWSMIGTLREAVRRSAELKRFEDSGEVWIVPADGSEPRPWGE